MWYAGRSKIVELLAAVTYTLSTQVFMRVTYGSSLSGGGGGG